MVRKLLSFSVRNGKREIPLEVVYNSRTDFFTKIPCNLTFNRNFQIFLINGKHPYFPKNPFGNCRLPPEVILSSWFNSLIMEVYCKRAQFLSMPRSLANASHSSAFRRLVLPYSDFILTHPVKRTPRL